MKNKLIPLTLSELATRIVTNQFQPDTEYNIVLSLETVQDKSECYYGFIISTQFKSLNLLIGEYGGQSETCFLAHPNEEVVLRNVIDVLAFMLADQDMKDTTVYLIEKI